MCGLSEVKQAWLAIRKDSGVGVKGTCLSHCENNRVYGAKASWSVSRVPEDIGQATYLKTDMENTNED